MKKLLSAILCVILLLTLTLPVSAAGGAGFSMSVSGTTVQRGDTVTFTVSVSSSEPATSYGLLLSYDSAALELVDGSCTVSGALVASFQNGFAFLFQNPTAYAGPVGTVTFKIKDNAAYGSYTVSGSPSVKNGTEAVAASGTSKTITVACAHSYSGWSAVGEVHQRVCIHCGQAETAGHIWDQGSVTKQPTCREAGSKRFSCTVCNATKTTALEKTADHSYGSWKKKTDDAHQHSCKLCGKEESAAHSYGSGTVTKKATCKEAGIRTFTCSGCNATKTEALPKLTTHTYDHSCDTDCNVCGQVRSTTHSYGSSWNQDKHSHWQACSVCKEQKDVAAHTPGPAATETKAQRCTVCSFELAPATGKPKAPIVMNAPSTETTPMSTDEPTTATEVPFTEPTVVTEAPTLEPTEMTEASAEVTEATTGAAETSAAAAEHEKASAKHSTFPWWLLLIPVAAAGLAATLILFKKKKA